MYAEEERMTNSLGFNVNQRNRTVTDLDGVGGQNDTVTTDHTSGFDVRQDGDDPGQLDAEISIDNTTTSDVDKPKNTPAAIEQRQMFYQQQNDAARRFLERAGVKEGSPLNWTRDGNNLTVSAEDDFDGNGTTDKLQYNSTLDETTNNGRRQFTLVEHGTATYDNVAPGDVAASDDDTAVDDAAVDDAAVDDAAVDETDRPKLTAPELGEGDGLNAEQQRAYEEYGRYTAIGEDAPLEPGVRSSRVPELRSQAIENLEALGIDGDVATNLGGPDDEFYGPKTTNLLGVEERLRELHDGGANFDTDRLDKDLAAEDFDLDAFDANSYVLEAQEEKEEEEAKNEPTPADAVGSALDQFDSLTDDGFVTAEKLAKIEGGEALAENLDSLIFASRYDEGDQAWHGLSKEDLTTIQGRLQNGETIEQIAADARANSSIGETLAKTNPDFTAEDFNTAVGQRRNVNAVSSAVDRFDDLADDGFLSRDALGEIPGANELVDRFDAMLFAQVDDSTRAYRGLTRGDLEAVQTRLEGGETLQAITDELMRKSYIGQALDGDFTYEDFVRAFGRDRALNRF